MSELRSPRRAVAAMFALNGALFGIWASRIPIIADTHHLTPSSLGLLLLFLAGGAIVAFPLAGRAADRYGSASVTRRIAVAYGASIILIALAPTIWLLTSALFVFGAAHGSMDVTMNAWAAEVERAGKRPMMSSFHALFSLGAGVGAATGFLAATYGLSVIVHFTFTALIISAVTLYFSAIPWQSDLVSHKPNAPFLTLPAGPLLAVGFVAFCASMGEGAMADWGAIFLVTVAHTDDAQAALGYTAFSVAMVVVRLLGDRIVARLGAVTAARLGGATAAAGSLMAVTFGTIPTILIGFGLMGIGYAVVMPLAFTRAANDETVPPGAAIASVSTLAYGGILLGPPLIGFAAGATSIRTAFLILSALAVLISVLSSVLARVPARR